MKHALATLTFGAVLGGCYLSGSVVLVHSLVAAIPPGKAGTGEGAVGDDASARLAERDKLAAREAVRGAVEAAEATPRDLRLQRRAAAMVRYAADRGVRVDDLPLEPLLERLAKATPCPGMVDAAATWTALGDRIKGGDLYVMAAELCESVDAAVAAIGPLRATNRCDVAIATIKKIYPDTERDRWVDLFDAVNACSDDVSLRRNLAFAPPDVVDDYLRLLDRRAADAAEAERRAFEAEQARQRREEEDRRERDRIDRANAARASCESECSAALGSCNASCSSNSSCIHSCSSSHHACRASCQTY